MTYSNAGPVFPSGVTMCNNNGYISCASITTYGISQSNTIIATNAYSNYATIQLGFDLLIPAPTYSNAALLNPRQATTGSNTPYNLSASFPFATQFSVASATYPGAAVIDTTSNLVVIGTYRGAQYSITVTGSNSSGACNVPVTVYESGLAVATSNGVPTFGTYDPATQLYPLTWNFTLSNCKASSLSNHVGLTNPVWTQSNNFLAGTLTSSIAPSTNPKVGLTLTWSNTANYLTTYNNPFFQASVSSPVMPSSATPSATANAPAFTSYSNLKWYVSWDFNLTNVTNSTITATNMTSSSWDSLTGTLTGNIAASTTPTCTIAMSNIVTGYVTSTTSTAYTGSAASPVAPSVTSPKFYFVPAMVGSNYDTPVLYSSNLTTKWVNQLGFTTPYVAFSNTDGGRTGQLAHTDMFGLGANQGILYTSNLNLDMNFKTNNGCTMVYYFYHLALTPSNSTPVDNFTIGKLSTANYFGLDIYNTTIGGYYTGMNSITAEATNRAGHCKSLYEQRLLGKY